MKQKLIVFSLLLLVSFGGYWIYKFKKAPEPNRHPPTLPTDKTLFKDGDIIFQTSLSTQSKAIQLATHSVYSHCGIILYLDNKPFVLEAVQPVRYTRLEDWIARGDKKHFVVKRLLNAEQQLTPEIVEKMIVAGDTYKGKAYDIYFEWSNDRIYCSELVWKIYKQAMNLELGKLQQLKDFDLDNTVVREKLKERYGNKIPLDESVISPIRMFNSELLKTVVTE